MKKLSNPLLWAIVLLVLTTSFKGLTQENHQIKVMTWNIRLDTPDDGKNQWQYRRDALGQEIQKQSPEILGVQEAMDNQMKDLRKRMKGYRSIGVARDDGKKAGEYSAIFYNKKKLKPICCGTFWLSETPDVPGSRGWDAACNRVVTWAEFEHKPSGSRFMMMNTHFDHMGDTARVESANLIIKQAAALAGKLPVIVTGDFNVTEKNRAYRILTFPENEIVLSDTRKRANAEISGPDFSYTGWNPEETPTDLIDFIFATWDIKVISNKIPSFDNTRTYLSDHLPVTAILQLP
jgi:endonuclease/exonuclease/phosphatase family metal-dependent hydrolase